MKKLSYYRMEVAPVVVLPLDRPQIFSYQSGQLLSPGTVVRVPFGGREVDGVVYGAQKVATRPPAWMKKVAKVVEVDFLTETQRLLAKEVSAEYCAPLGKTLRHFLPRRAKPRKLAPPDSLKSAILKEVTETTAENTFLESYKKLPSEGIAVCNTESFSRPERLLVLLAKRTLREKKQILILVPEITLFPGLVDAFEKYFPRAVMAVLHSKLPGSRYFDAWERVRAGSARIILATRQGLFAPFPNLGLIVVTEEDDESYKQWDMAPRYDARRVVRILARLSQARLLFSGAIPSIESFWKVAEKQYVALSPLFSEKPLGEAITLVNLKLERFQKNTSPLSQSLKEKIQSLVSEKKQVLLYVERQGLSFFSLCESCKNIFRCPRCRRALSNTAFGYFHCRACGYKTALFPGCPACRHLSFRHIGFGTQRIEREVKKLFPEARVFRADSSTMKERKAAETLYRRGMANNIDILIGTQMILKRPPLPKLSLVAIIDADSLLTFPDFRADERYLSLLYRAAAQTRGAKDGVLVQTFHPESTLNQRLLMLAPEDIYRGILEERRALQYPPYTRMLLVTCAHVIAGKARDHMLVTKANLEKILKKTPGTLTVLTEEPKYKKRERFYEYRLALMIAESGLLLPPALSPLLQQLSPLCRVDVDPLTLI